MTQPWSPIWFRKTEGAAPIVLICEHASSLIPAEFEDMGLGPEIRASHAAWDIGAEQVAARMSALLDAPMLSCGVSRLLYDCNRPQSAPDSIPARSEVFEIPGNVGLSAGEAARRYRLIHEPFHLAATQLVDLQAERLGRPVAVVTVHSFTRIYNGEPREVELGFLCDSDNRLSEAALQVEGAKGRFKAALNAPYSAADGVTYSLARHAEEKGLLSTMIEIRNDLIDSEAGAQDMADHLADTIRQSLQMLTAEEGATS